MEVLGKVLGALSAFWPHFQLSKHLPRDCWRILWDHRDSSHWRTCLTFHANQSSRIRRIRATRAGLDCTGGYSWRV